MSYVVCPATITSPDASVMTNGMLPDNMPCEAHCPVATEGEVMDVACPRGHRFFAHRNQIVREERP